MIHATRPGRPGIASGVPWQARSGNGGGAPSRRGGRRLRVRDGPALHLAPAAAHL